MANKLINKITRVSDLPEYQVAYGKTIVAFNRENYAIDLSLIRGKKITNIKETKYLDKSKPNDITIFFSDGTKSVIHVYNGTDGQIGTIGDTGEKGNTGQGINIDKVKTYSNGQLTIVNDIVYLTGTVDEYDETCEAAWSALRGKSANEAIEELNETFITDAEYNILFNEEEIQYINAEYTTTSDNQAVIIFNTDTNPHTKYRKFWTFEESDIATYYVYNPVSQTYDPVVANLWDDIYLGATKGYFAATTNQFSDGTELYYFDASDNEYKKVNVVNTIGNDENEPELHEFDFKYYDETLDAYVNVHYDYITNTYEYSLDALQEIEKKVYEVKYNEETQTNEYKQVDISTIDVNAFATYYEYVKNEEGAYEYVEIENIATYLQVSPVRWFAANATGDFIEIESEADIDKENYQEYIKVTIDNITSTYTFHRWSPVTKYEVTYYVESESVYDKSGVQLYAYTEDRTYFTSKLVTTTDESGNTIFKNEYTAILIPDWIFAEYTTTDEDQYTLILNSVAELGEEDNTEIDTTSEDYEEEDEDLIPVQFVTAGELPTIYEKDGDVYTITSIDTALEENKIFYNGTEIKVIGNYWIISDELEYEEVLGADVPSYQIVYYLTEDNKYKVWKGTRDPQATYYIGKEKYEELTGETLSNYTIVLFAGIPQQLPINFYPLNANNKKAVIDYDSEVITFYEDGRITSMEENGETDITITPETGESLNIHVILMTPMASIITSGEDAETHEKYGLEKTAIRIGESTEMIALTTPATTSNKNIDFELSNDNIELSNKTQSENTTVVTVTGTKQGKTTIWLSANDGYGASATLNIEVVNVVTKTEWTEGTGPNDIKFVPTTTYDANSAWEYNSTHGYNQNDEGYVEPGDVIEEEHYEMTILRGVTYELAFTSTPDDSDKADITWNAPYGIDIKKSTKVVSEAVTHEATEEDVDNGLADEIGAIIVDKPEEIASIYNITGEIAGTYQISGENKFSANYGYDTTLELKVNVIQSVDEITISPSNLSFNINSSKQLVATIEPDTADNKEYVWESKNTEIATVSNGVVTGVGIGNTEIYAKALDGSGVFGTATISITEPLSSISFDKNGGMIYVGEGKTETINAVTVFDGDSTPPQIIWKSANESIATVSGTGNIGTITGVSLGSTIIMAVDSTNSGIMATLQINVIRLATALNFGNGFNEAVMQPNNMFVLVPEFTPADTSIQVVNYESSDESIAKVSSSGIVTAIKAGTAVITATTTDGTNLSAECTIEINE